jgi:5-methylthioadenosine/S-adenosylhomocysteine deaminase
MRVRVEAAAVWPGGEQGWYAPGQVTWSESRIESVGPLTADAPEVDRVIRAMDGFVLPGLLNGHNHAAMSLMRGIADDSPLMEWLTRHIFPLEAHLTSEDVYVGTLLSCAEMIRGGTVGFADMYFFVDAVAQAVETSGLRGWIARGLVEVDDPGGEKLAEAVEFARRWRGQAEGRVVGMLGPHAPYTCGPRYLEQVAEAAHSADLGIHIHLAESWQEVQASQERFGLTPVELAARTGILQSRVLVAHGVHLQDQDRNLLAAAQGGVVHCPVSNAKLGNGTMDVVQARRAGVTVGLGTDGPASTNTLDMFLEMKAMAWGQKVLHQDPACFKAVEALRAATEGNARILGGVSGRLEPGAPADLIVVGAQKAHLTPVHDWSSNAVYAATASDVRYTICNGVILMEEGRLLTLDEEAVRREATARARALLERSR